MTRSKEQHLQWTLLLLLATFSFVNGKVVEERTAIVEERTDVVEESFHQSKNNVKISCNSHNITLFISSQSPSFNGMIYPKGLSKNSSCMTEYIKAIGDLIYVLPLRSCDTMSTDVTNGIEFFNTIVIQPHRKLVTNQGREYHIRCRYETSAKLSDGSLNSTTTMPGSSMKIYSGELTNSLVAENVKIGDPLTLLIGIDEQNIYGMMVTDCSVRDGLGWSEQKLINEKGCPLDSDILGSLEYGTEKTTAFAHFKAHKFPYTSSVYYQCNIRLCIKHARGCENVPPNCDEVNKQESSLGHRLRRETIEVDDSSGYRLDPKQKNVDVKVYSGLYVNDATDLDDSYISDKIAEQISEKTVDENTICFPQKDFAIGIAIAGLLLMLFVIAAILCLLSKRRRRKDLSTTTGSSIYSGPYSNTAYSHSS